MTCVCGAICEGCGHFAECGGCDQKQGRVFWTQYIQAEVCPIYQCVKEQGLEDCGQCSKLPCEIWMELKDPALSEEAHQRSIRERADRLKAARNERRRQNS